MIASTRKGSIMDRMLGAALLEAEAYEEAALVPALGRQAAFVVIITAMAAGLGGVRAGVLGIVVGALSAAAGWALYAFVTYRVATTRIGVTRTTAVWSTTWRTLAMAGVPRVFLALAFLPSVGFLIGLVVHTWVLITTVFGMRLAMELDVRSAVIAAVSGTSAMLLVWALTAAVL